MIDMFACRLVAGIHTHVLVAFTQQSVMFELAREGDTVNFEECTEVLCVFLFFVFFGMGDFHVLLLHRLTHYLFVVKLIVFVSGGGHPC